MATVPIVGRTLCKTEYDTIRLTRGILPIAKSLNNIEEVTLFFHEFTHLPDITDPGCIRTHQEVAAQGASVRTPA